jgi:hypothetical protein
VSLSSLLVSSPPPALRHAARAPPRSAPPLICTIRPNRTADMPYPAPSSASANPTSGSSSSSTHCTSPASSPSRFVAQPRVSFSINRASSSHHLNVTTHRPSIRPCALRCPKPERHRRLRSRNVPSHPPPLSTPLPYEASRRLQPPHRLRPWMPVSPLLLQRCGYASISPALHAGTIRIYAAPSRHRSHSALPPLRPCTSSAMSPLCLAAAVDTFPAHARLYPSPTSASPP